MHWVEREGLRVPRRVSGHPALDFCNTWAGWGEPPRPEREWLKAYANLIVWAHYAELVDTDEMRRLRGRGGDAPARALSDARRLRTFLHAAVLDPTDHRAVAGVTGYLRRATATARLRPGPEPQWDVGGPAAVELPLLRVAWAGADLLTSGRLGTVKACPGVDCGWVFLDPSDRRRWCSMSSCGNRAKVRSYAERHR